MRWTTTRELLLTLWPVDNNTPHTNLSEEHLSNQLLAAKEKQAFRQLTATSIPVDLSSNDYLGLARSEDLEAAIQEAMAVYATIPFGATGSRLLTGNNALVEEVEAKIAAHHLAASGLLFSSGYLANIGLLSSVPKKGDTILYDERVHASIRDGIRLSFAQAFRFAHNDVNHLERLLQKQEGRVYVVVESYYSMDGDLAPLEDLVNVCEKYRAALLVDEAHATGIFGKKGEGLMVELGLQERCFARVITFGKAIGSHGAMVLGSPLLRDYLINFCRSFIYTTGLPKYSLLRLKCTYDNLSLIKDKKHIISNLCQLLIEKVDIDRSLCNFYSNGPIIPLIVGGNERVKALAKHIQTAGFDVRPVLAPTVSEGTERIRICVHSFNTEAQIEGMANAINQGLKTI